MRKWWLVAVAAVLAASVGGYLGFDARAGAVQNCEDWANQTFDLVSEARTYLYEPERPDAFQGSDQERAQALFGIADELLNTEPPDDAGQIDGDLQEALQSAAAGYEAGGSDGATLVYFGKSIVYNADARLVTYLNGC
jgi:hypothetical protein